MGRYVFNSIEDFSGYIEGEYGDGMSADEAMQLVPIVAEILRKNLKHHIDNYYASYVGVYYRGDYGYLISPWGYVRTEMLKRSLDNVTFDVKDIASKTTRDISCEFSFDEDMAKSESILNELGDGTKDFSQYEGNRVDLIQGGWRVKKNVWFKNIEHFGYQEGYDFIGKAIDDTFSQIDTNDMVDIHVVGARNVHVSGKNSAHVYVK